MGKEFDVKLSQIADSASGLSDEVVFDEKATKRLVRKIDLVLLPVLSILYLLSFLDRSNIGNARLAGLEKDLHLKGLMYNAAVAVFFPTYAAAEIPSNIIMKRLRPSIWIPSMMVAWGIVCVTIGLVHNYAGLLVARAFLGLTEGGLFPGITFFITTWYKREECGLRLAIFYSSATAAGAFGGLIARGIMQMKGLGGKSGWSWIFIVEGLLTLAVALGAFYFMQDYPDTAGFLTEAERKEVKRRLENDRDFLADEYNTKFIWQALKDWKIYVFSLISCCLALPTYSVSLFLPTIVKELGYKNTTAQLMTTPPYIVACLFCIAGGYAADKMKTRGPFMIGFSLVAMIGFLILINSTNDHVKYAGCFFITSGLFPSVPQGLAWASCNIGGTLKRSVGIATFVMFANVAALSSAFIFLPKFGPHYHTSHAILLATSSTGCALSVFMTTWARRENARREAEKPRAAYTDAEMHAQREMGDDAGFWRYTT
ncbi:putative high-affinity nicotinic acid transporter protein [Venturia nashicola]|uniref:Putative high-affinity nicotinic acid transporter protein n=1 Tax=Venturia nashicola TaxID=86259 RepID=A0A4Z1P0H4_9PEZI|nr:putative high-affinity nicotinic acid transporter protein [Venturia nashicola]TLD30061.1 putative high-affinity nicotinic acid transporter protein [Venturia nashicola]